MASSRKTRKNNVEVSIYNKTLFELNKLSEKPTLTKVEIDTICSGILKFVTVNTDLLEGVQFFLIAIYLRAVSKATDYPAMSKLITAAITNINLMKPVKQHLYINAITLAIENKAFETDFKKLEIYYNYLITSKMQDLPLVIYQQFGAHYFAMQAFEKAIPHYKALIESENISAQLLGHTNLGQCYKELGNLIAAVEQYAAVIKLYEIHQKSPVIAAYLEYIAIAAHNCAKLLDNYEGDIAADPELALYYYRIAAKLNNQHSLHDLGYKYEHGEDVRRNVGAAINFYRRAAKLGNVESLNNLYILLDEENADSSAEAAMLEKHEDNANIRASLFTLNMKKYLSKLKENLAGDTGNEFAKKAFAYAQSNARVKHFGLHNLATLYHFGIGVDCNEHIAEKYYLESIDNGFERSKLHLQYIYEDRLRGTKSRANIINVKASHTVTDEIPSEAELEFLKKRLIVVGKFVEYNINSLLDEADLATKNKITALLEHTVSQLNIASLVSIIHRVGILTESSLNHRQFHNQQLPKVFLILKEVEKRLALQAFDYSQIVYLIEGLSKFYLQKNTNGLEQLFLNLYQEALHLDEGKDPSVQVKIIYAATRLEPDHAVLKEIISKLIAKVSYEKLDNFTFAKYYYAMAILSCSSPQLLTSEEIKKLVNCSVTMLLNIRIRDEVILRQQNVANYFFIFSNSQLFDSNNTNAKQELANQTDHLETNTMPASLLMWTKGLFYK
jgi:TPR repeat protein